MSERFTGRLSFRKMVCKSVVPLTKCRKNEIFEDLRDDVSSNFGLISGLLRHYSGAFRYAAAQKQTVVRKHSPRNSHSAAFRESGHLNEFVCINSTFSKKQRHLHVNRRKLRQCLLDNVWKIHREVIISKNRLEKCCSTDKMSKKWHFRRPAR